MKPSTTIPVAIVIGGAIIAVAVYASVHKGFSFGASTAGDPSLVAAVSPSDHILGNPAAPVKIIEYSDYDCSFCKDFDATLHQLIANDGASGKVAWVYRNYPIVELHPNARKAAEAAECVALTAGNDVYWRFAEALFANQPVDPTEYAQYANAAGADPSQVATCEENAAATVDARIDADIANAKAIGAQGTPYSILLAPGHSPIVINGAYPLDTLQQEIGQAAPTQ